MGGGDYTTRFENTHKTVRREVLYAHHPWFTHEVWVHAVIEKADGVFFRCTLDGTETDRFLEIPAWMFDRAWCSQCHVTRDPFVSLDTLRALSSLLDFVLKTAIHHRMPGFWAHAELLATRIGEKPMSGKTATCARADQLNRRLRAQQMDLFGSPAVHGGNAPAWRELPSETQDVLVNLMTQLMLEHAQRQASATATVEASHDH